MENYRMGCSGNRPYNRTCGMNMPQPSNRNMNSSECSVRNTTGCSCTIPGVKEKKHEMFSHLPVSGTCNGICSLPEVYRKFPTAVCIKCRNHFPTVMQTILWKERYSKMKTDCSQKQLLNRIDQVSFAVNDMTLYLDTHPCDEKALTYCHELVQERKKLLKEYAEAYGPLIIDITDQTGESIWKWMEQPFPWEKEGACR